MKNFNYYSPTSIHFGTGKIAVIETQIPKNSRVLLLYGLGSIKSNGVYDQVVTALAHHTVFEFSGVQPNPQYNTMLEAITCCKKNQVDYILAVGGGSVIDAAKFIATGVCLQNQDPWLLLSQRLAVKRALPIGCILTLPATGSETNGGAVIMRDHDKLTFSSPLLRPTFAILDPSTTLSLPTRQVSNGIVDAFIHTIEQYLTYPNQTKLQDRFAESVLLTLIEEGPQALKEPNNIDVRANIMWCATMALNGIIGVGAPQDWSTHMIGHELTALFNIDHARTLSIILPANLKVRQNSKKEKLLQYANRVWGITTGSDQEKIDQAIVLTELFFQSLSMPIRLHEENITSNDIDSIILQLEKHNMLSLGERGDVNLTTCKEILLAAL